MSSLCSHIAGIALSARPFIRLDDGLRISLRTVGPDYPVQPEGRLKPQA